MMYNENHVEGSDTVYSGSEQPQVGKTPQKSLCHITVNCVQMPSSSKQINSNLFFSTKGLDLLSRPLLSCPRPQQAEIKSRLSLKRSKPS